MIKIQNIFLTLKKLAKTNKKTWKIIGKSFNFCFPKFHKNSSKIECDKTTFKVITVLQGIIW